jgi:intergrase/recombinase
MVKFCLFTGLRPAEAVESARLVRTNLQQYYNPERQALEHFRFPEIFLRQTKKAYISFVTPEMLDIIVCAERCTTYNAIRHACNKLGLNMDMRYCRKVFASWLHKCGISDTVIDLLQGRTDKSVLVNHYLSPSQDFKNQIIAALNGLKKEIEV